MCDFFWMFLKLFVLIVLKGHPPFLGLGGDPPFLGNRFLGVKRAFESL